MYVKLPYYWLFMQLLENWVKPHSQLCSLFKPIFRSLAAFHSGIMRLLLVGTLVSLPLDLFPKIYIFIDCWCQAHGQTYFLWVIRQQNELKGSGAQKRWWKSERLTHFAVIFNLFWNTPSKYNGDENPFDLSYMNVWGWQAKPLCLYFRSLGLHTYRHYWKQVPPLCFLASHPDAIF